MQAIWGSLNLRYGDVSSRSIAILFVSATSFDETLHESAQFAVFARSPIATLQPETIFTNTRPWVKEEVCVEYQEFAARCARWLPSRSHRDR